MNPLLEVRNLSKAYRGPKGTVRALEGINLTIGAGEFVGVQGPSGCGKTTLLLLAGGLLQPEAGNVLVNGQDVYALPPAERALFRAGTMGFVFQQFHLIPYLSIRENILAPTLAKSNPQAESRAAELIQHFGLGHRERHVPAELSTGERQRTALARALLNSPKLLLADEPTGNLDGDNARTVLSFLAEFAKQGGGVLLVTHDSIAAEFTHRTLRLAGGRFAA